MKIVVEIELPDDKIIASARRAVDAMFDCPRYRGESSGEGHTLVANAVAAAVRGIDFGPLARAEVNRVAADVVAEVAAAAVRAEARKVTKAMAALGQIPGGDDGR